MKTNAECALYILRLLKYRLDEVEAAARKQMCDEAGRAAAEKVWEESNPDNGVGFGSGNPYTKQRDRYERENKRIAEELDVARSMYEFAVTKICNEVKES